MAKLKIVDNENRFLVEIDGTEVPFVTSYTLTRTVSKTMLLKLALAINETDIEIETDKIITEER